MVKKINYISNKTNESGDGSAMFEQNSWVNFTVLDIGAGYKVRRVEILPHKQLIYQQHPFHTEQWVIVQGTAKITINNRILSLKSGEAVKVGIGETPCVENSDNSEILIFIKVQCGLWFDKEDYVRYSDGFDKAEAAV